MLIAGSIGLGLVWGWLLILLWRDVPGKRPLRSITTMFLATALVGGQLFYFTSWPYLVFFLITAVLAFIIHLAWRTRLATETE